MPTRRRTRLPSRTAPTAVLSDAGLAPLDETVHVWPGRHVDVNGWRAHVRSTPSDSVEAEPALFLHGLGGSALNWTELAAALRHRLAVESIDLAGHGRSGPAPADDYGVGAHAGRVIAYLEQSGRGPVHLAGNSMGGAISIVVAARRPDLVRTLTLVSPAVSDNRVRLYPLRADPRMAMLAVPVVGEQIMKRFSVRIGAEERVRATLALCFADASRYPEARLKEDVDEAEDRVNLPWAGSAFLRSMRSLA